MEEEDNLRSLVRALGEALRMGFSSSSAPTTVLLDTMVDIALRLANNFDRTQVERLNPQLIQPKGLVDVLNNPKFIKLKKAKMYPPSPAATDWFMSLAVLLSQFKKGLPEFLPDLRKQKGATNRKAYRRRKYMKKRSN